MAGPNEERDQLAHQLCQLLIVADHIDDER
jgi:hypothetical protein